MDNQKKIWHPGMGAPENLQGTTRTLGGAVGSQTREPIEPGLVSRSGWAVESLSEPNRKRRPQIKSFSWRLWVLHPSNEDLPLETPV